MIVAENEVGPRIGIALSGGGSRAIAFHLGCLRALHRIGVLDRSCVLSTVSGGSVIGAIYVLHEGPFAQFEDTVRTVLANGLLRPSLRTIGTTPEGAAAAASLCLLACHWASTLPVKLAANLGRLLVRTRRRTASNPLPDRGSPRRFASMTTVLRRTMDELLFKGRTLGSLPATGPQWLAVATELRTRTAFYFGRKEGGCYPFGKVDMRSVTVAHAVVASAAYPLFLPPLDDTFTFVDRHGALRTERVMLTDGGVYDNLGLSPLWPDRDPSISVAVEKVDVLIACRAGYGSRVRNPGLSFKARMAAVYDTTAHRAQNAVMKRLFDVKAAGSIAGFALPYIDQNDRTLAFPPPNLVRRTEVMDYPTNFDAMPQEWINKLAKRGEQLTLAVIREHLPDLFRGDWDGMQAGEPIAASKRNATE